MATHYEYDLNGRVIRTTSADPDLLTANDQIATETSYTPLGQVDTTTAYTEDDSVVVPIITKNVYDQQGRLVKTIRDWNSTLPIEDQPGNRYEYDSNGQRIIEYDELDLPTRFRYDSAGRLIRSTYPGGAFTATTYDAAGRTTSTTDREGHLTMFEYDHAGRQKFVVDALARSSENVYDAASNLKTVIDPAGRETSYHYDALNRRIRTEFADGTSTRTEYDLWPAEHGRIQREFDQLDRKTEFRYDDQGRLREVHQWVDAAELITRYEYDVRGNRTKQNDANGHETLFEYDRLGRLTTKTYPEAFVGEAPELRTELYQYDIAGNLVTKTIPITTGGTVGYNYDRLNRLTTKDVPGADPWLITYTADGQRESVTSGAAVWQWTYEPLTRRLDTFTDPFGRSLDYGYDRNGNRTSVATRDVTTTFEYDVLNRLIGVTDSRVTGEATYDYDPVKGVLATATYPNGTTTSYGYDGLDRVKSIEHRKSAGALLASFTYSLGATGRRDGVTESLNGATSQVDYGYDDLDRLVGEHRTGPGANYHLSWDYDAVGNRVSETRDSVPTHYTYDLRDRLKCESAVADPDCLAPAVAYAWDNAGRMLTRNAETFTWDAEDRLLQHAVTGGDTTAFDYDIDGIRFWRQVGGDPATEFLVDANRQYQEVVEEWTDDAIADPVLAMEYLHGGTGLLWQRAATGSVERFFHADGQMSTRLLTAPDQTAASNFTYEAFGADVGLTGTAPTAYRYTGQQADSATSGYYLRARYMSPGTGRFLSADPMDGRHLRANYRPLPKTIAQISGAGGVWRQITKATLREPGTLHGFIYANDDPVQFHDPSGEHWIDWVARVAIVLLIAGVIGYLNRKASKSPGGPGLNRPGVSPHIPDLLPGANEFSRACAEHLDRCSEHCAKVYSSGKSILSCRNNCVSCARECDNLPETTQNTFDVTDCADPS